MKVNEFIHHIKHNSVKIKISKYYEVAQDIIQPKVVYDGTVGTYLTSVARNELDNLKIYSIHPQDADTFRIMLEGCE